MSCRNNTSFHVQIENKIKKIYKEYNNSKDPVLTYYQNLILELISKNEINNTCFGETPPRGILIYWEPGKGKTILAIALAEATNKDTIVLLTKSLENNFKSSIDKYHNLTNTIPNHSQFKYVSLNAFNMSDQMKKITLDDSVKLNLKKKSKEDQYDIITGLGSLDNKLLIIDEAHRFFKSVINSETSNARKVYDMVIRANNLSLVFLTGTPVTHHPFEIVPCFNMLGGENLLPVDYNIFKERFLNLDGTIKNRSKLQNRLNGLVSYMPKVIKGEVSDFPTRKPTIVDKVEMSEIQWDNYIIARDKEQSMLNQSSNFSSLKSAALLRPKITSPGAYKPFTRPICNYANPGSNNPEFTPKYSPKAIRLLYYLKKAKRPCLIHSNFTGLGGLGAIAKYLLTDKYVELNSENISLNIIKNASQENKRNFIKLTGTVSIDDRENIRKIFNMPENKYGQLIFAILGSEVIREGYDFKYIEYEILYEALWNYTDIEQFFGRGERKGSHNILPVDEQWVQPIIFLATPNTYIAPDEELPTTDEDLYHKSIQNYVSINEMSKLLQEISLECVSNNYENCHVCLPTDEQLFNSNIDIDLDQLDPCKGYTMEEANINSLNKILYNGVTYLYKTDIDSLYGWKFLQYREDIDAYEEMDDSDIITEILAEEVNKKKQTTVVEGSYESWNQMTKSNINKYKKNIKKIYNMSEEKLKSLNWNPYNNEMKKLMEKQYETGGIADIINDKVIIISEVNGATYENGEAITFINGSNADIPGIFVYHTHPYLLLDMEKIHSKNYNILPFMMPSISDLIHSIHNIDGNHAYDILTTVEGLYIYAADTKIIDSALGIKLKNYFKGNNKYPNKELLQFKQKIQNTYSAIFNKHFTLNDLHQATRNLGFKFYYIPNLIYNKRYPYKTYKWKKSISFHKYINGGCYDYCYNRSNNHILKYVHYIDN